MRITLLPERDAEHLAKGPMESDPTNQTTPENLAVQFAHEVLKQIPGAAFDGEPFMLPTLGTWEGKPYVACCCYYHSVVFLGDRALVFSREEGGMVPWAGADDNVFPHPEYFDRAFALPDDTSALLVKYVQAQIAKETVAQSKCVTMPKP
jgi:hypothetical protein